MKPVDVVVPGSSGKRTHRQSLSRAVWRCPGNRTFQWPLTLLFDPAVQVIAQQSCILKLSKVCRHKQTLLELVPKYFDPRAVTASREAERKLPNS